MDPENLVKQAREVLKKGTSGVLVFSLSSMSSRDFELLREILWKRINHLAGYSPKL